MADKTISELVAATAVGSTDLFVLEQNATAKKLTGQVLENWLVSFADGHGGVQSFVKVSSSGTNPVVDTWRMTYADETYTDIPVTNGVKGDTGATGATGATGPAVSSVTGPVNPGQPGATDTYTMYVGQTPIGTFEVYNGINGSGAVSTVNNISPDSLGNVTLSAADVGALPSSYTAPVTSVNGMTGQVVVNQKGSISLSTSWSGSGPYTQTVTVSGATVTNKSKVDLQPDSSAIEQMLDDGCLALYIVNNNGTLTAYAVGAATTAAMTVQCSLTEVV